MKELNLNVGCFLLSLAIIYPLHASSQSNSFPKGVVHGPFTLESKIYPGTAREYWIYEPAQYNHTKATCSMIVQDGLGRANGWNLISVLDSLIDQKVIPVMIGIFVMHGKVQAAKADQAPRYNRSFEYDALGDRYVNFLLEELLPEVSKSYNLSQDANDRCIAGASSGAICAFNAAWERPAAFSRVLSTIGTYVGLRGGDSFATLVRKTEPKPIRIFLQDGNTDLNIYAGDWWMANQDMLSAFQWAGYEVDYRWDEEGHNSVGGRKILPQALAFLWDGYPQKVNTHLDQYSGLDLLMEGEGWNAVELQEGRVNHLANDREGNVLFTMKGNSGIYRILENKIEQYLHLDFIPENLSVAENGALLVGDLSGKRIIRLDSNKEQEIIRHDMIAHQILPTSQGFILLDTLKKQLIHWNESDAVKSTIEIDFVPKALSLSAEKSFLAAVGSGEVFGYSFQLDNKGAPQYGQPYIHYHIPYGQSSPNARSITTDRFNRTYSTTSLGVQIADQLGRINLIINTPGKNNGDIIFGGKDWNLLYLVSNGKLYHRKIKSQGAATCLPPFVAPPAKM